MHLRCCSVRLSYRSLLEKYNLLNYSSRRLQLGAMLLYDLCRNKYDCAAVIGGLCYRVLYRAQQREARPHQLFAINRCRASWSPVPDAPPRGRLQHSFNAIDIITSTVGSFRTNIFNTFNYTATESALHHFSLTKKIQILAVTKAKSPGEPLKCHIGPRPARDLDDIRRLTLRPISVTIYLMGGLLRGVLK
ncbi:hypothetical protein EVAR_66967_1 [Eumeta japonica]|uniref:Uncharacterized protein n=1 Tax=Eumeta variegata TaxID=151549 RepID=A0A4C1ZXW7_EUMVA|nr:hypothetical protein EVAR_66967_1 [Eumeta japonica]